MKKLDLQVKIPSEILVYISTKEGDVLRSRIKFIGKMMIMQKNLRYSKKKGI